MSDNRFKPLSEGELNKLSSDELIAYIRKAADAGRPDAARTALAMLCWRHFDDITRRVRMRIPAQDVEDVAMIALTSAIKSAFDGTSVGEFVVWINTIVRRRIADYHRSREGDPDVGLLPTEHQGEDDVWGEEPATDDATGAVVVQSVIDECLEDLSEPHRDVIELNVFQDLDAAETARQVNEHFPDLDPPMSDQNVHQIVSRFRRCVRSKLADEQT